MLQRTKRLVLKCLNRQENENQRNNSPSLSALWASFFLALTYSAFFYLASQNIEYEIWLIFHTVGCGLCIYLASLSKSVFSIALICSLSCSILLSLLSLATFEFYVYNLISDNLYDLVVFLYDETNRFFTFLDFWLIGFIILDDFDGRYRRY